MIQKKEKKYLEIILLGIITLLISFMGIKYPTLLFAATILSSVPIVVITTKYKEATGAISCLAVFIILGLIYTSLIVLIQFLTSCIIGVAIGYCLRNKLSLSQTIVISGISYIVCFILIYLINLFFYKVNIIESMFINNIMNILGDNNFALSQLKIDNLSLEKAFSIYSNDAGQLLFILLELLILIIFVGSYKIGVLFYIIPGIIVLMALVTGYFTLMFSLNTAKKMKYSTNSIEPFAKFRLPDGFGVTFIIIQLMLWGTSFEQGELSKFQQVLLNLALILNFSFFAQGVAAIDFWVSKKGINGPLKTIIYIVGSTVLFPFVVFLSMILMIIGMIDYVMDLRKLETK